MYLKPPPLHVFAQSTLVETTMTNSGRVSCLSHNDWRPYVVVVIFTACIMNFATETIMQLCHGKRRCSVIANSTTFGKADPCRPNSRTYLKVVYTCGECRIFDSAVSCMIIEQIRSAFLDIEWWIIHSQRWNRSTRDQLYIYINLYIFLTKHYTKKRNKIKSSHDVMNKDDTKLYTRNARSHLRDTIIDQSTASQCFRKAAR